MIEDNLVNEETKICDVRNSFFFFINIKILNSENTFQEDSDYALAEGREFKIFAYIQLTK